MVRRHGQTPLGFLADLGVLGPGAIIAHAIFRDRHPWLAAGTWRCWPRAAPPSPLPRFPPCQNG